MESRLNTWILEHAGTLTLCVLALLVFCGIVCILYLVRAKKNAEMLAEQREEDERFRENVLRSLDSLRHETEATSRNLISRDEIYGLLQQSMGQMNEISRSQMGRFDAMDRRMDLFGDSIEAKLSSIRNLVDEKLDKNDQRTEKMRETMQLAMQRMQDDNGKRLEEMRQTVDEKLHATLEKRLSDSFQVVSSQLDQVSRGLGEMRTLATGVGDLKKVLTNVKTRGVWGEMQLGALLEQVMSKSQYEENVQVVPGSNQRVEYAVKLPGREEETIYLPIDAKFPVEDYERLLAAYETGDGAAVQAAQKALEDAIKTEAKRISSKYIAPPFTTDFAIMFLPIEGLYAETLRIRGLSEQIQGTQRVVIAGPTTLTALLTSLQVGFKTLAIEKRSSDVWKLLGAVKTDFGHFADLLETTQNRLRSASDSIEKATTRSRTIERKLRNVESLEECDAKTLLSDGGILPHDLQ